MVLCIEMDRRIKVVCNLVEHKQRCIPTTKRKKTFLKIKILVFCYCYLYLNHGISFHVENLVFGI